MSFDVCVVGAGLSGLSSALCVQQLIPRVKVTVIADDFGRFTSTHVTRRLFLPAPFDMDDVEEWQARVPSEWLSDSWRHHHSLVTSDEAGLSGHSLLTGSCYWWHEGLHVRSDLVLNYRNITREEMNANCIPFAKGCEFTTVHVNMELYLPWLMKQIRQRGARILFDTVFSLQELYGQYDVVINCAGMRCREIHCDQELTHVKGSRVQVHAPEVDEFLITQDDINIVPSPDGGPCEVGTIWEPQSQVEGVDEDTSWLIMHRACRLEPRLKDCPVVNTFYEKRPFRTPMLLKMDTVDCGGPQLPVVHNVGHGMDSLTIAWGAACQVAQLVQEFKRQTKPFAKLCRPFGTLA